jgi:branched-subunit amino acid ABC-type transport system permease component
MLNAIARQYEHRRESWNVTLGLIGAVLLFAFFIASEMQIATFASLVFSGLLLSMLLFLVAAGLSLIFGLMDILNFSHGQFFMVGAYIAWDVQHPAEGVIQLGESIPDPNLRFLVAVILATIVGAILGVILERGLLRPLYARPLFQLVLTFGISIVMLEAARAIWAETQKAWKIDIFLTEDSAAFSLFGTDFSIYRLFIILMGVALIVGLSLLLNRTRIGIIIRAGVDKPEMVSALGINVRAVFTLVFTLGCAVAAFGGAIAVPYQGASLTLGSSFLLASIAAIVIGGLGSFEGTAVGSILVGLMWSTMQTFNISAQISGTFFITATPMLLLIIVLLLRPQGLFGGER